MEATAADVPREAAISTKLITTYDSYWREQEASSLDALLITGSLDAYLTLVGGQKYAFLGLPSLTLAGQNVL